MNIKNIYNEDLVVELLATEMLPENRILWLVVWTDRKEQKPLSTNEMVATMIDILNENTRQEIINIAESFLPPIEQAIIEDYKTNPEEIANWRKAIF
jgi:hypothetical protein